MPHAASGLHWHKDAIIYELHVRTFCDSNGDGVGDFNGLTSRLDYLQDLGVSCLWLLPFFASPLRDDGYDVAHYRRIHPAYGSLEDFTRFLDEAHARGLRVITELVLNHTSDQHPWFQAARRAPAGSRKRNFYVWSATDARYAGARVIFKDAETSNWTWDETAGAFYWHRFFRHQPDLNFDNPHVIRALQKVVRFWLGLGVDGLRLDAVAHLFEREGTSCENLPETHDVLRAIRADIDRRFPDRILIAEANQWPSDVRPYFGEGDECHMAFHFPLMARLFLALKREDARPIVDIIGHTAALPDSCQWATFLRNHDELTLSAVTDDERDALVAAYAPDPAMRLNRGIRRRLATLLDNDVERIVLAHALLLSLPGSPVIYYGDEIGLGDDVRLPDRDGLRLPMPWTDMEKMARRDRSPLAAIKRLIGVRREHPAFGRGTIEFLETGNRRVLAFVRRREDDTVLVAANLSTTTQSIVLESPARDVLTLAASGWRWLRLAPTSTCELAASRTA